MNDLLTKLTDDEVGDSYSARDIEVLEGLEPVRRRPGMYVGGTDEAALHHLAAEILDNAMDEAVAGYASSIDVSLETGNWLLVRDNGRGIPVDPHPKFKKLSALEVILTTLHSGGKFGGKAYATSGGLHGVGSSVVNALSDAMDVEVARDRVLWRQSYKRGKSVTKLTNAGPTQNRRGTTIRFHPDPEIFGALPFIPTRLYRLCRSKAYLFRGVRIRWSCDASLLPGNKDVPADCGTACRRTPATCRVQCRSCGPGTPTCQPLRTARLVAGSSGRWRGSRMPMAFSIPIATPCRRRRAGRMRPDSALPC